MSEYHKIETLYERDERTFKVKPGVFKSRAYTLLKTWEWTEKIDGTNIRVMWDAASKAVTFGGKTDKAQMHAELLKHLQETFTPGNMATVFAESDAIIYGEGYGSGIQKGGGAYGPTKKFIAFDVLVGGKWWLGYENVSDIASKLSVPVVPYVGTYSIEVATEMVRAGFVSRIANATLAEGLVGRPAECLFDKKGHRLITKLKTKDFD